MAVVQNRELFAGELKSQIKRVWSESFENFLSALKCAAQLYLRKQNHDKKPVSRQNQPMLLFNPLHIKTFFFMVFIFVFLHKVV